MVFCELWEEKRRLLYIPVLYIVPRGRDSISFATALLHACVHYVEPSTWLSARRLVCACVRVYPSTTKNRGMSKMLSEDHYLYYSEY